MSNLLDIMDEAAKAANKRYGSTLRFIRQEMKRCGDEVQLKELRRIYRKTLRQRVAFVEQEILKHASGAPLDPGHGQNGETVLKIARSEGQKTVLGLRTELVPGGVADGRAGTGCEAGSAAGGW